MTNDIVARLPDAATRRLPDFIRTLRINREKRRESVYASDNVYALLDALDAAEARVRELEAENKRLAERLDLLAVGFGVPDGGRYIADWQTKIEKLKAAERDYRAMIAAADTLEWTPPFKPGDRVTHVGRSETGTVTGIEDGSVVVEFDNPTPRGNKSIGKYDAEWFRQFPRGLIAAAEDSK